jgi:F-box protein 9
MDPDVDKHYKQKYFPAGGASGGAGVGGITGIKPRQDEFHSGYSMEEYHPGNTTTHDINGQYKDPITALTQTFASLEILSIEPEDPEKPCLLSTIPDELVLNILLQLSLQSLSSLVRTSQVCKKLLSLSQGESSLYKALCMHYFRYFDSPSITVSRCLKDYGGDWRRMLIERPRIRFDGCYIATCHYLRPGVNDLSWNTPIHMVTYFRFVRFYSSGRCITVLTTLEPRDVVHSISWTGVAAGVKGVSEGVWKMSDSGEVEIQVTGPRGYIFIKDLQVSGTCSTVKGYV